MTLQFRYEEDSSCDTLVASTDSGVDVRVMMLSGDPIGIVIGEAEIEVGTREADCLKVQIGGDLYSLNTIALRAKGILFYLKPPEHEFNML